MGMLKWFEVILIKITTGVSRVTPCMNILLIRSMLFFFEFQ